MMMKVQFSGLKVEKTLFITIVFKVYNIYIH